MVEDTDRAPCPAVARLVRTRTGGRLDYDEGHAERHTGNPARALATTLPVRRAGHPIEGVILHPYFTGLLPEGALELATAPVVELLRLLELHAFSYVIADGDLHAKNLSLLWRDGRVRLAPAYDLLSTLVYGDAHMALQLDGRDQDLTRSGFVAFGARFGLRAVATERMLTRLVTRLRRRIAARGGIAAMGLAARRQRQLERTLRKRLDQLAS